MTHKKPKPNPTQNKQTPQKQTEPYSTNQSTNKKRNTCVYFIIFAINNLVSPSIFYHTSLKL